MSRTHSLLRDAGAKNRPPKGAGRPGLGSLDKEWCRHGRRGNWFNRPARKTRRPPHSAKTTTLPEQTDGPKERSHPTTRWHSICQPESSSAEKVSVNQLTQALKKSRYVPNLRPQQTAILHPTAGGEPCPPETGF